MLGRLGWRLAVALKELHSCPLDALVDAEWYLNRYPDVAVARVDALKHFRRFGWAEGRSPNPGEEDLSQWAGVFDSSWYFSQNEDVRLSGLDPLEHFIHNGLVERRQPNAAWVVPSRPVTSAHLKLVKNGALGVEVALLVTHAPNGCIKPHVRPHLDHFRREGVSTVLIVASDARLKDVAQWRNVTDVLYVRANEGFDFAAWAHIIRDRNDLLGVNLLLLCNDSIFGPISSEAFSNMMKRIRSSSADVVGLTENTERGRHIQSYFIAFKRRILSTELFKSYINGVVSCVYKNDVIRKYEISLTDEFIRYGFQFDVLFRTLGHIDQTVFGWKNLISKGFPYIKVSVIRGLYDNADTTGWREQIAAKGYDVILIDKTIAELEKARLKGINKK